MQVWKLLVLLSVSLLLGGCASITSSEIQPIAVTTLNESGAEINAAHCSLRNDKGEWKVETPTVVDVRKSFHDLTIECEKDGSDNGAATVVSSASAGLYGNIIFGGLIGVAIDHSRGTGYTYPSNVSVIMGESKFIHTGSLQYVPPVTSNVKKPADKDSTIQADAVSESQLSKHVVSCSKCLGAEDCPFKDNGNGTVTDRRNSQVWMRCSYGQQWNGETCKGDAREITVAEANSIGNNMQLGNMIGWRIPHKSEMAYLISSSCVPAINAEVFPNTPNGEYASFDTTQADYYAHYFKMLNGQNFRAPHTYGNTKSYVRFVRK